MGAEPSTNESNFAVEPYAGNTEPRLWFKQLVIRRGPGREDRAITFNRGLNIIWSERKIGGDRSLNTGNTSLARLLRYCMGEDHFGTAVHELRIQRKFPAGAVAAQLRLANAYWWVFRSFTNPSHRTAIPCEVLDDPWTEFQRSGDKGFSDFQMKLQEVFTPKLRAHKPSEIALGFISRDHEGGFDNVFRWRAAHNNSGPSIREDLRVWDLCALLGFKAWKDSAAPDPSNPVKISNSPAAPQWPHDLLPGVAKRLGMVVEPPESIAALPKQASKNEAEAASALERSQERLRELVELERSQAQLLLFENRLEAAKKLRNAKAKLKLRANGRCKLTKRPISELLDDKGCLLKGAGCYLTKDDEVKELGNEIKIIDAECGQIGERIAKLKDKVGELSAEEMQATIAHQKGLVDRCQSALLDAHGIAETLKNLNEVGKAPSSATVLVSPVVKSESAEDTPLQNQESDQNFAGFVDAYQRVVSFLISPAAAPALNANSDGIHDLLGENEELGSKDSLMKLWAFDFATLVRSIESPVFLPGILIHDSPKQEDLADEEYWRLFSLARALEQGDQASALFQYIITTSTPPPNNICDDRHVRLHLAPGKNTKVNPETCEEEDDGYLFGCRF